MTWMTALPVRVGQPWREAVAALRAAGKECQEFDGPAEAMFTCAVPADFGDVATAYIQIESVGPSRVDRIWLKDGGNVECGERVSNKQRIALIKRFSSGLTSPWVARKPVLEGAWSSARVTADIKGDQVLEATCSMSLGFSVTVTDAWKDLPANPVGLGGVCKKMGCAVGQALFTHVAATRAFGSGPVSTSLAFKEVDRSLRLASTKAGALSSRSRAAFGEYRSMVTADWFWQEYLKGLSAPGAWRKDSAPQATPPRNQSGEESRRAPSSTPPQSEGTAGVDGGRDDALSEALSGGGSGGSVYVTPKPDGSAALPDTVSDGQVTEGIKGKFQSLVECADKGSGSGATVVMQWDITAEGTASAVKCKAPCGDVAVGTCLGAVIKSIRFPRTTTGRHRVEFPFKF
jgi:hypothetical protein